MLCLGFRVCTQELTWKILVFIKMFFSLDIVKIQQKAKIVSRISFFVNVISIIRDIEL